MTKRGLAMIIWFVVIAILAIVMLFLSAQIRNNEKDDVIRKRYEDAVTILALFNTIIILTVPLSFMMPWA